MDRKAGYKECPRCGLRNKPSALQCDFCGLRFIAGEDWDDNIQALEKMGDNDEKVLVDEDVSKRIEATIVKRDKFETPVKTKDREPERQNSVYYGNVKETAASAVPAVVPPAPSIAVSRGTVIEKPAESRPVERVPEPVKADPAPERIVIADQPMMTAPAPDPKIELKASPVPELVPEPSLEQRPTQLEPVAEPKPEKKSVLRPSKERKVVRRVVRTRPQVLTPVKSTVNRTALTAVLALGVISYLVALMFGDSSLGRPGGWAMVTVSSMIVVVGVAGLFIPGPDSKTVPVDAQKPEARPNREVLICPKCHELVKESDRACPDCGAEFRGE
jgi:hypothetical protein